MTVLSIPPIRARFGQATFPGLPVMYPVRQKFPVEEVKDVASALTAGLNSLTEMSLIGKKIAVTAGSRGIKGIGTVLQVTVRLLQEKGAEVFIIPAMGSHGGATEEGQTEVLKNLGLTEEYLGTPIRSSKEAVSLGTTEHGLEVFCDALAYESDGIVVCNRIKAHNVYKAEYESGLVKMLVIGLGKHRGAIAAHRLGFDRFAEVLPAATALSLSRLPVLAGIGLIENAYGKLAGVEVLAAEEFLPREPELLRESKRIMGRLLMDKIDVLIVDEIGKEFSGGGMDANVTGRSPWGLPGFSAPSIGRIIVRDLSEATAGNAIGLGLADFTTKRCAEKIDLTTTYTNALTANSLLSPKIPVIAENDREALSYALHTLIGGIRQHPSIVRIRNTKDLELIQMSQVYLDHITENPDLNIVGEAQPINFDDSGMLVSTVNK